MLEDITHVQFRFRNGCWPRYAATGHGCLCKQSTIRFALEQRMDVPTPRPITYVKPAPVQLNQINCFYVLDIFHYMLNPVQVKAVCILSLRGEGRRIC